MKSMVKRILSAVLVLCLCLSLLPNVAISAEAASTGLSLSQLRQKFPHGKYWNHAGNPGSSNSVNNQDGYTSTPCSQHGVVGTSKQTCNGFQPSGTQLSWQCMGYAEKLGYDATGYNPRNNANGWYTYTSSSALDSLKPGDIVRYKNNGHSIYVTGVNGDTVTYTDCNSDGHCIIRWDVTISKSTLRSSFTHVRSAPSSVSPGSTSCSCSTSYAGTYICTTSSLNLTIRSGHGSSYSAIGSIPPGATVTVSKASGTSNSDWAHVTYNGVTGYASMQYLSQKQATQQRNSRIGLWLSDSEMGSSISTIRTGEWLYLCYKLYDTNTGDLLDTYNTSGGYTAKLTLYEPNGAVAHTYTFTNDNNWISIKRTTPGNYKGELVFTWNSGGTTTSTVSINMVYEPRVTPSVSDIQLNVTGTNSQTISISYSGATNSNSIYLDCTTSGDCFSYKWGSWSDHKMPLTITGVRDGQGVITIKMYDSDTDQIIATSKVYVTVTAPTYTVSYNANGGTGAPSSQTKYYNTTLTLSSTKPTRTGYTFLGWSTSSTATSVTYQPSDNFTSDANTTLYAVWKVNPTALSVNSSNSAVISTGGEMKCFTFTPSTSGKYVIYSTGSDDTKVYLYNASGTELDSNDDDGDGNNFRLEYSLTAGTTYTFGIKYYNSSKTGTISFKFGNVFTVTYNANGGTGAPSNQEKIYGTDLTLSSTKPTKNYAITYNPNGGSFGTVLTMSQILPVTFKNWTTSANGSGTPYLPNSAYTGNANVTLYAQWTNPTIGELPSVTRSGYTFNGWYTAASGGTKVTSTSVIFSNTTLYAQWTPITYTVSFNANGGTGAPGNQIKTHGTALTLSSTKPTKSYTITYNANGGSVSAASKSVPCTFNNWKAANGTTYQPGGVYALDSATTLTAQWTNPTAGTLPTLTRTGYTFNGWYTAASGGTKITPTSVISANTTLYAQWIINTHTITFNANGGTGAPSNIIVNHGSTATLSSTAPTRFGYTFLGWSTSSSATAATYKSGDTITVTSDMALYAVWKSAEVISSNVTNSSYTAAIASSGDFKYFKFTPAATSKYRFESTGSSDPQIYLYDANGSLLASNDDGGESRNFLLDYKFNAGTTYYIKVNMYSTGTGTVNFSVKRINDIAITTQPKTTYAKLNETASVTIAATGDGLTYAWYFKNPSSSSYTKSAITSATYSATMQKALSGRQVYCVVSDKYGNTVKSNTVYLYLTATITKQPVNTTVAIGSAAKASITAAGDGLTYTWYFKNPGSSSYTKSGFTSSTYTMTMQSSLSGRQVYCVVTDKYGNTAKSNTVTLKAASLKITTQPKTSYTKLNVTANATVAASGEGLKYTWYFKNPGSSTYTKSGITSSTYSVAMQKSISGRQVYCVVSDKYGNTAKSNTVTLYLAVTITKQPVSTIAAAETRLSIPLTAVGDGLTYQWYYIKPGTNTSVTSGVDYSSYNIKMEADYDGRRVYCIVTDKYGNTAKSNTVTINVPPAAKITTQPKTTYAKVNETAKVTIAASGDGLKYTWYFKNPGSSTYTKSGITSSTYSVTMQNAVAGRKVYCVVSDKYGNSVKSNTITLCLTASITTQPKSAYAKSGDTAKISVAAAGDGLTYTWYFKNPGSSSYTKSGITASTYSVTMQSAISGRKVYCVVADKYGNSIKSDTVTLYINATITKQPTSTSATVGSKATVSVTAAGNGLTYTWYFKNPGSSSYTKSSITSSTYTMTMQESLSGRKVYCVVTDKKGNSVRSNTVTLTTLTVTVKPVPGIDAVLK